MKLEEKDLHDIFNDSLFIYICKAVAQELEDVNMREKAGAVQDILVSLSK